jgi:hypothetical protein
VVRAPEALEARLSSVSRPNSSHHTVASFKAAHHKQGRVSPTPPLPSLPPLEEGGEESCGPSTSSTTTDSPTPNSSNDTSVDSTDTGVLLQGLDAFAAAVAERKAKGGKRERKGKDKGGIVIGPHSLSLPTLHDASGANDDDAASADSDDSFANILRKYGLDFDAIRLHASNFRPEGLKEAKKEEEVAEKEEINECIPYPGFMGNNPPLEESSFPTIPAACEEEVGPTFQQPSREIEAKAEPHLSALPSPPFQRNIGAWKSALSSALKGPTATSPCTPSTHELFRLSYDLDALREASRSGDDDLFEEPSQTRPCPSPFVHAFSHQVGAMNGGKQGAVFGGAIEEEDYVPQTPHTSKPLFTSQPAGVWGQEGDARTSSASKLKWVGISPRTGKLPLKTPSSNSFTPLSSGADILSPRGNFVTRVATAFLSPNTEPRPPSNQTPDEWVGGNREREDRSLGFLGGKDRGEELFSPLPALNLAGRFEEENAGGFFEEPTPMPRSIASLPRHR